MICQLLITPLLLFYLRSNMYQVPKLKILLFSVINVKEKIWKNCSKTLCLFPVSPFSAGFSVLQGMSRSQRFSEPGFTRMRSL
jgi:hypothetical protein